MKLRNKKTGRIIELNNIDAEEGPITSLAELNDEWEDYEEPKLTYWIISENGTVVERSYFLEKYKGCSDNLKEIGNYFETREEAEKAVEKLKAWKRLKDKGFRFERWLLGGEYGNTITFSDYIEVNDETRADLDLLFGGEE